MEKEHEFGLNYRVAGYAQSWLRITFPSHWNRKAGAAFTGCTVLAPTEIGARLAVIQAG